MTPLGRNRLLLAALCLALCGGGLDRPEASEEELEAHIRALRQEARNELQASFARIVDVGYRLKAGGAELCGDEVGPILGAAIARRGDFVLNPWIGARLRGRQEEAEEAVGVVGEVKVFSIVAESPADRAGIEVGDFILAVNGGSTGKTTAVFSRLSRSNEAAPTLRVRRAGTELDLALPRVEGCNQGILAYLSSGADTIPHANRHEIWVPTGLVRFCHDDDELAIAISHQIAHQVLDTPHPRRGKDEPPADRLGLLIAARAGFDVSKAPGYWDRLAAEEPWKIHPKPTWGTGFRLWHGAMALRAPVIRDTMTEIQMGLAAEGPLQQ